MVSLRKEVVAKRIQTLGFKLIFISQLLSLLTYTKKTCVLSLDALDLSNNMLLGVTSLNVLDLSITTTLGVASLDALDLLTCMPLCIVSLDTL